MSELAEIQILHPAWALVPLVMLILWVQGLMRARYGLGRWHGFFDRNLREFAQAKGYFHRAKRQWLLPLLLATLTVISLALATPARRDETAVTFRNVNILVLAIDLSNSITEGGAIADVQAAAQRILDQAEGRPVALVLYAGQSYLVAAPSLEPENISSIISVLDQDVMPDQGSRPDHALQTVNEMLRVSSAENADVVVISDGGGVGAEAEYEAEILNRELDARVFTLVVDPPDPAYGAPPAERAAMVKLAQSGGGQTEDIGDVEALVESLQKSSKRVARNASQTSLFFKEYGRWVLLLALPFLLLVFRKRVPS